MKVGKIILIILLISGFNSMCYGSQLRILGSGGIWYQQERIPEWAKRIDSKYYRNFQEDKSLTGGLIFECDIKRSFSVGVLAEVWRIFNSGKVYFLSWNFDENTGEWEWIPIVDTVEFWGWFVAIGTKKTVLNFKGLKTILGFWIGRDLIRYIRPQLGDYMWIEEPSGGYYVWDGKIPGEKLFLSIRPTMSIQYKIPKTTINIGLETRIHHIVNSWEPYNNFFSIVLILGFDILR